MMHPQDKTHIFQGTAAEFRPFFTRTWCQQSEATIFFKENSKNLANFGWNKKHKLKQRTETVQT